MNAILIAAVCLIAVFVFAIPLYRWLLHGYAPRRYAQLKSEGRFHNMPATWDELWKLWTEPQDEFMRDIGRLANLEDPRVFYGRFVDRYLGTAEE